MTDKELAEKYAKECELYAKELRLVGYVVVDKYAPLITHGGYAKDRFLWIRLDKQPNVGVIWVMVLNGQIHCRKIPGPKTAEFDELDDALDWISERLRDD